MSHIGVKVAACQVTVFYAPYTLQLISPARIEPLYDVILRVGDFLYFLDRMYVGC